MAKKEWDFALYKKLNEEKFNLEDANVQAYRKIRDLKSLRISNGRKIIDIENKIRVAMGFSKVKTEELK